MKAQSVAINLELLGAQFANMNSIEQASFFRGLAKELSLWPSNHSKQVQFSYVSSELSDENKKELENALIMLWFKES